MPYHAYPAVWLAPDGILRIDYGRNPRIDLDAIQSALAQHQALGVGPRPVLICAEGMISSTPDAEAFGNSAEVVALTRALAMLTPGTLARMMAQLYLRYRTPAYPCRAFEDEADALDWLATFLPEQQGGLALPPA